MSAINTFSPAGFTNAELPSYSMPSGGLPALPASPPDSIVPLPQGGSNPWASFGGLYGGSSSGNTGLGGFSGVMNGFMNLLASAMSSLGNLFGVTSPASSVTSPVSGQTSFTDATARSVGDPHDAFSGTTAQGTQESQAWNDTSARADLLDSDSFSGGYRISTTATAPRANGTTLNASATIATANGTTDVTLQGNGSSTVTENGRTVGLVRGQATALGGGEIVTLNADGSLTVADTAANGGSIATTLSVNADGGVDVNAHASNVDLGGYLVNRATGAGSPMPYGATPAAGAAIGTALPLPASFGAFTSQTGTSDSFGDLAQLLGQDAL